MNKIYSTVWNAELGQLVVASELAKGGSVAPTGAGRAAGPRHGALALALAVLLQGWSPGGHANTIPDAGLQTCNSGTDSGVVGRTNPGPTTSDPAGAPGSYSLVGGCQASGNSHTGATAYGSFSQITGIGGAAFGFNSTAYQWATAVGLESRAEGKGSTALGFGVIASEINAVAIGGSSSGTAGVALTVENSTTASGLYSIAIGAHNLKGAQATDTSAIAIGGGAASSKFRSIALGTNSVASAERALALGSDAKATAINTVAIGEGAQAAGGQAVAIGYNSQATTDYAIALGSGSNATGLNSTALGRVTQATAENATAIGHSAQATALNAIAIGYQSEASKDYAVALGSGSNATALNSLALGRIAKATAEGATAVGKDATAGGVNALAIGTGAQASGVNSISIGTGNQVSGNNSGAIGDPTVITGSGSYSVGNDNTIDADEAGTFGNDNVLAVGATGSRIVGNGNDVDVADAFVIGNGADVTVAGGVALGSGSVSDTAAGVAGYVPTGADAAGEAAIAATVATRAAVDVGSRQITGVAAGSADDDAVNVSQLSALADTVDASATHYYSVNDNGVQGGNYDNDGATGVNALAAGVDASATVDSGTALGNGAVAGAQTGDVALGSGSTSAAVVNTTGATVDNVAYTYAGTAATSTVSVGSVGAERTLTNVAAGRVDATSTDAINGSQLFATDQAVDALGDDVDTVGTTTAASLGGTSAYDPATHTVTAGLDVDGTTHTNVQDALTQLSDTANAGWNVTDGTSTANIGPDGTVTFTGDSNLTVAQTGADDDGVVEITLNETIDLGPAGSVTTGEAVLSNTGLAVGPDVALGNTGLTIAGGPSVTTTGIDAGGTVITNVAPGVAGTDGVNVDQLTDATNAVQTHYYSVNDNGVQGGNYDNDGATGVNALAAGVDASATADSAVALGNSAGASGIDAVAIGTGAQASGVSAISIGTGNQVSGNNSGAIGDPTVITGSGSYSVGNDNTIDADEAGTFGNDNVLAVGATGSRIVGNGNNVDVADAFVIGNGADVTVAGGVALGSGSVSDTAAGVAGYVPTGADAAGAAAIAATVATRAAVDVGSRQITGVAAGTADDDAVNVSQLSALADTVDATATHYYSVNDNGVQGGNYDNDGATGVNAIAAGVDASATVDSGTALGNGAVAGAQTGDVALGSGSTTAAVVNTTGATVDNVDYTYAGTAATSTVSVGSVGAERTLTNVAAGRVDATSTDAINGSQLFATDQAVDALGDDVDTVGTTTAASLGGTSAYDPAMHTVTAGLDVDGTTHTTVQDALTQLSDTASAGWNISAQGANATNVAPDETVDLNNSDGNIVVGKTATDDDVTFDLADDIAVDSVTAGGTVVDGTGLTIAGGPSVTTAGIDAGGLVIGNVAPGVAATDAVNVSQLTGLSETPMTFTGNAGTVDRLLGEELLVTGEATSPGTYSGANLRTEVVGNELQIQMTDQPVFGTVSVNTAGAGTINGLTNQTFDPDNYTSGQAATEDQLKQISDTTNAGWNVTDGTTAANIGPDGTVTFTGDSNLTVTQTGVDDAGEVEITLNETIDLGPAGSVTTGDTVLSNTGVTVGPDVALGSTGLVIAGGPSVTATGIDAGGLVIGNVAPGVAGTDAVNLDQLTDTVSSAETKYYHVNSTGGGNENSDGATGVDAIAIGKDASAGGNEAMALGLGASADGDGSLALGSGATASHGNSVALGAGSATLVGAQANYEGAYVGGSSSTGEVNVGGRQITGVAAGAADSDAVNVSQLQAGVESAVAESNEYTDTQIDTVNDTVNQLDDRVTTVEGDVANLDDRVTNVEGDVTNLSTTVNQFDDRITDVEDTVTAMEDGTFGAFQVSEDSSTARPSPTGTNSSAGGAEAVASGDNALAVGNQSTASANNSTALGTGAEATHDNSVALGAGSATTVGAQNDYNAAYVGSSNSTGEVNIGGRTLTGVAPGIAGTDAVNVNQLNTGVNSAISQANQYTDSRITGLQSDVWQIERGYRGATASAMAMAGLPQAYLPGKSMLAVGFGGYQSEYGMAIGLSGITDNGSYVYKVQASGNTTRDWGFSVGAGIQW